MMNKNMTITENKPKEKNIGLNDNFKIILEQEKN